jgi:hypothetical protein
MVESKPVYMCTSEKGILHYTRPLAGRTSRVTASRRGPENSLGAMPIFDQLDNVRQLARNYPYEAPTNPSANTFRSRRNARRETRDSAPAADYDPNVRAGRFWR